MHPKKKKKEEEEVNFLANVSVNKRRSDSYLGDDLKLEAGLMGRKETPKKATDRRYLNR